MKFLSSYYPNYLVVLSLPTGALSWPDDEDEECFAFYLLAFLALPSLRAATLFASRAWSFFFFFFFFFW